MIPVSAELSVRWESGFHPGKFDDPGKERYTEDDWKLVMERGMDDEMGNSGNRYDGDSGVDGSDSKVVGDAVCV